MDGLRVVIELSVEGGVPVFVRALGTVGADDSVVNRGAGRGMLSISAAGICLPRRDGGRCGRASGVAEAFGRISRKAGMTYVPGIRKMRAQGLTRADL